MCTQLWSSSFTVQYCVNIYVNTTIETAACEKLSFLLSLRDIKNTKATEWSLYNQRLIRLFWQKRDMEPLIRNHTQPMLTMRSRQTASTLSRVSLLRSSETETNRFKRRTASNRRHQNYAKKTINGRGDDRNYSIVWSVQPGAKMHLSKVKNHLWLVMMNKRLNQMVDSNWANRDLDIGGDLYFDFLWDFTWLKG